MTLWAWRHPRPHGVAGRCIGHTDVAVDPRKAKRLAHRIRQHVRRQMRQQSGQQIRQPRRQQTRRSAHPGQRLGAPTSHSPHLVVTSPLQRSASVGRWLKAWGWAHRVDARLCEMDFGAWDGQRWDDIGAAAVGAWCAAFAHGPAGGGESVAQLLARCAAFIEHATAAVPHERLCIVGHAGWISAALWLAQGHRHAPTASDWPRAVDYGRCVCLGGAQSARSPDTPLAAGPR